MIESNRPLVSRRIVAKLLPHNYGARRKVRKFMSDAGSIPLSPRPGRPKVGFLHRFDARNIRSWSGTFSFMAKALEKHVGEVVYLGPDNSKGTRFIVDNVARFNRVWQWWFKQSFATDHNRVLSHRLGRFFERRLLEAPCDVLFAPVGSVELANLRTDLPVVYYSDLTWAQIIEYYPDYSSICSFGQAEGELIEAAAIRRAESSCYPSDWAADSACNHYGASRETTFTVRFGANLTEPPTREDALNRSMHGKVNLLLVGVDWIRKGAPIAVECLDSLLARGIDANLTTLGCKPPEGFSHPHVRIIPFLSKNDPEQRKQIARIFLDAHFMLLPTRADATPIVTCEASAFGLPTLATDTGGLRGSVREGANGFLLPLEAGGVPYADIIDRVIADPAGYKRLVVSSRDEYETTLNWDAWGNSMRPIFERVLGHAIPPGPPLSGTGRISETPSVPVPDFTDNVAAEALHP